MANTTLLNEVARVSEAAGYLRSALIAKGFNIGDSDLIDKWADIVKNYEQTEEGNVTPFKVKLTWTEHFVDSSRPDMGMGMGGTQTYNKDFIYTTSKDMTKFEGEYGANVKYVGGDERRYPTIYEGKLEGDIEYVNNDITGFAIGPTNISVPRVEDGMTVYDRITAEPLTYVKIEGGKNLLSTAQLFYGLKPYSSTNMETGETVYSDLTVDLSGLYTRNVINMYGMFSSSNITPILGDGFDTRNVLFMYRMFSSYKGDVLDKFLNMDTSKVTNMKEMWASGGKGNAKFNYDTSKVTDMCKMFSGCNFTGLDLTAFDTTSATDMGYMFSVCSTVTSFKVSANFFNSTAVSTYDFSGLTNWTNSTELSDFVGILPDGNGRTIKFSANTKTAMTNAGLISTIEGKHWTVA